MSDVRANIPELREFERNLNRSSSALRDNFNAITAHMKRINDSWKDQENEKFMRDFIPKARIVVQIAEQMEEYSKFIRRKTDILDNYTR